MSDEEYKDDNYTIVPNSRLSHERNVMSYWHEVARIMNGDYEKQMQT